MKKFSFELEEVLEVRNFEQKQAEAEVAKCLSIENEINENLKKIAQQYVAVKTMMKGSKDFDDIASQSQFNNLIAFQKENLLKELAQAQIETEKKREILKACMQKTQALEKMKEIKFNEYREEVKKTENKRIEEIASIKINSQNLK
ncbi:MAG: flagellar export protein FliJ [Treponema sp.]|nr:flagellar export protein FliJ [Treponema sp.]